MVSEVVSMKSTNTIWGFLGLLAISMFILSACSPSQPATKIVPKQTMPVPTEDSDVQDTIATPEEPSEETPIPSAPKQAPAKTETKAGPTTHQIAIEDFKFIPASLSVKAGDTVIWTNKDSAPHTVKLTGGISESDDLSRGDTFEHTFTESGTFTYICGIHPSMKGSVSVS